MKSSFGVWCATAALLLTGVARAEDTPTVAWIDRVTPKPGSTAQIEAAAKKHFAWHRSQKDTWSHFVWQVVTGDRAGQYVVGTFGHTWKELDAREAFDKADMENVAGTVGPFTDAVQPSLWTFVADASRSRDGKEPAKYSQLTHYFLKTSEAPRFMDAIKEIKVALDKADYPVHLSWYALVSGGEGPQYVLAIPRDSWSAFAGPEKTLTKVLDEQLGGRKATELLDTIRASTRYTVSEVLEYRPDISYVPGS